MKEPARDVGATAVESPPRVITSNRGRNIWVGALPATDFTPPKHELKVHRLGRVRQAALDIENEFEHDLELAEPKDAGYDPYNKS